jgi:hypothetical protein
MESHHNGMPPSGGRWNLMFVGKHLRSSVVSLELQQHHLSILEIKIKTFNNQKPGQQLMHWLSGV